MQFYSVSDRRGIPAADMELFRRIAHVVHALPDHIFEPTDRRWGECPNQYSCHLICRGIAAHFTDVSVRDGHFYQRYQHSWLVPKSGRSIIDPYPVGGGVPFIAASDVASPWTRLYKESSEFETMFWNDAFREQEDVTKRLVQTTLTHLAVGRPS